MNLGTITAMIHVATTGEISSNYRWVFPALRELSSPTPINAVVSSPTPEAGLWQPLSPQAYG